MNFKNPEYQVAHWLEVLSTFPMTIEHRPGRLHGNIDGLSRKPGDNIDSANTEDNSFETMDQMPLNCMQIDRSGEVDRTDEETNIELAQTTDDELSKVRIWVQNNKRPIFKDISSGSSLWTQFPCLELRGGLLFRKLEHGDKETVIYQAILPRKSRRPILNYCHDIKTSGHLGVRKTISRINQKFTGLVFKQMFAAILQIVNLVANGRDQSQPNVRQCR